MNHVINVFYVVALFVCSSCDKWLDVQPDLDIYETTLFESEQGYYIALNGLYVDMSSTELWGKEMVWGAMEAWGHSYAIESNESSFPGYVQLMNYEYDKEEAKNIAKNIWEKSFRVIAEANNLLQNIANDNTTFIGKEDVKNMIIGEALAVRAMMHFEMVRIFAQAPIVDGGTSKTVPYVTQYPSEVNPPLETNEVLEKIMIDLDSAKVLLQPFDAATSGRGYQLSWWDGKVENRLKLLNSSSGAVEDEIFRFRCNRLNYYAVSLLLARVGLWAGDMEKARENAFVVVTATEALSPLKFTNAAMIGDPAALENIEPRLQTEILFGTYNRNEPDWTNVYFGQNSSTLLAIDDKVGIFAANGDDCRLQAIPGNVHSKYMLYGLSLAQMTAAQYIMPVLRIPEAYFIYAESSFDDYKDDAIYYFNQFVEARNNDVLKVPQDITKEDFMEQLVQEFRREYLSEGQIVFMYKRLNLPLRSSAGNTANNGNLVLPVPDSEAGV